MTDGGNTPEVSPTETDASAHHRRFAFGDYVLDEGRAALLRLDEEVPLRPKTFEVLAYFVRHAGRVVSRDELMDTVWGDVVVTDASITQCILQVRRALGDDDHSIIRTVPRRGYLFDLPVTTATPHPEAGDFPAAAREPASRRRMRLNGLLAAVTLVVVLAAVWWSRPHAPPPPANSIAVLAFTDMSAGGTHRHLGEGIAEEILNRLAQDPQLLVTARTSSFVYGDGSKGVKTIASELGVAHVLEGSVRVADGRVRVTVQLIDGERGVHRWSNTYQRALEDVLRLQAEISADVAARLGSALLAGRPRPPEIDPDAYDRYLEARFLAGRRGPGDLATATERYRETLERAPDFAQAWAGLAGTYYLRFAEPSVPDEEKIPQAQALLLMGDAVRRALELDPFLPEAHSRAGNYYYNAGRPADAVRHFRRAFELGPNDPHALAHAAYRATLWGDPGRGLDLTRRSVRNDPYGRGRALLIQNLIGRGRLDEAREEIRLLNLFQPDSVERLLGPDLVRLALIDGRLDEARERLEQLEPGYGRSALAAMLAYARGESAAADAALEAMPPGPPLRVALARAEALAFMGREDEALDTLIEAHGRFMQWEPPRPDLIAVLYNEPFLAAVREDPRWLAVAQETRSWLIGVAGEEPEPDG